MVGGALWPVQLSESMASTLSATQPVARGVHDLFWRCATVAHQAAAAIQLPVPRAAGDFVRVQAVVGEGFNVLCAIAIKEDLARFDGDPARAVPLPNQLYRVLLGPVPLVQNPRRTHIFAIRPCRLPL